MKCYQPIVAGPQNVRLGESRTIGRCGRLTEGEERSKGLDCKVRHGLDHRYFDQAAVSGPAPLHQCGQNAVTRIKAGDRVGQRGAQKSRAAVVDHDTQKSAQRLRDRVVARTIGIWATRAKAAYRAVNQARIYLQQPRNTGTEALRGAWPEVLDEDIGLPNQPIEQFVIRRSL